MLMCVKSGNISHFNFAINCTGNENVIVERLAIASSNTRQRQ